MRKYGMRRIPRVEFTPPVVLKFSLEDLQQSYALKLDPGEDNPFGLQQDTLEKIGKLTDTHKYLMYMQFSFNGKQLTEPLKFDRLVSDILPSAIAGTLNHEADGFVPDSQYAGATTYTVNNLERLVQAIDREHEIAAHRQEHVQALRKQHFQKNKSKYSKEYSKMWAKADSKTSTDNDLHPFAGKVLAIIKDYSAPKKKALHWGRSEHKVAKELKEFIRDEKPCPEALLTKIYDLYEHVGDKKGSMATRLMFCASHIDKEMALPVCKG